MDKQTKYERRSQINADYFASLAEIMRGRVGTKVISFFGAKKIRQK